MTELMILDVEMVAEREMLAEALILAEFERDTDIEAWIALMMEALNE